MRFENLQLLPVNGHQIKMEGNVAEEIFQSVSRKMLAFMISSCRNISIFIPATDVGKYSILSSLEQFQTISLFSTFNRDEIFKIFKMTWKTKSLNWHMTSRQWSQRDRKVFPTHLNFHNKYKGKCGKFLTITFFPSAIRL